MSSGPDQTANHPLAADMAQRLRDGDEQLLGELFESQRTRLWRMVRFRIDSRLASRVDPDDVLQEAFLNAKQRMHHYLEDTSKSLFIWFRLIVGQTLIDIHRRHLGAGMRTVAREAAQTQLHFPQATSSSLAAQLAGSVTSPSHAAARAERSRTLEQAISSMSPIDQEIIALRHFEDLTNAEVAEVLNIATTAASNRYVRALARLKQVLASVPGFADSELSG